MIGAALRHVAAHFFVALFCLVWLTLVIMSLWNHYVVIPAATDTWAKENGWEFVRKERRRVFRGPFFWSGKNARVYRIEVRDRADRERAGWLSCRSLFPWGPPRLEVRWDEEPAPATAPAPRPVAKDSFLWDRDLDG